MRLEHFGELTSYRSVVLCLKCLEYSQPHYEVLGLIKSAYGCIFSSNVFVWSGMKHIPKVMNLKFRIVPLFYNNLQGYIVRRRQCSSIDMWNPSCLQLHPLFKHKSLPLYLVPTSMKTLVSVIWWKTYHIGWKTCPCANRGCIHQTRAICMCAPQLALLSYLQVKILLHEKSHRTLVGSSFIFT